MPSGCARVLHAAWHRPGGGARLHPGLPQVQEAVYGSRPDPNPNPYQVQEALYGNVHSVTLGCGEAVHRMPAC